MDFLNEDSLIDIKILEKMYESISSFIVRNLIYKEVKKSRS